MAVTSIKSPNTPTGETSRDTASSIAVTLDSDRMATENMMTAVAANTNPRWKWYLIFFGLQLALFSSSLEYSIVSTALPKIGADLDAMLISSWVVTSYIVTQNAFQPIWAKLSDIFGRKCILLVTLSLFLTCSALCGVSQSMTWLITARAFQGIGVAGVFPLMYIIVADIVPLDKRASYEGLIQACFTFATVCGPFIGGTLTDHVSWRGIFFVIR
ncbi:MFS general substrate transporter [Lichtheimia hyalospora FSU 10163]|nr:MFS general substrate transporter [Lichtheimia hyalospora FSU 10163]